MKKVPKTQYDLYYIQNAVPWYHQIVCIVRNVEVMGTVKKIWPNIFTKAVYNSSK